MSQSGEKRKPEAAVKLQLKALTELIRAKRGAAVAGRVVQLCVFLFTEVCATHPGLLE